MKLNKYEKYEQCHVRGRRIVHFATRQSREREKEREETCAHAAAKLKWWNRGNYCRRLTAIGGWHLKTIFQTSPGITRDKSNLINYRDGIRTGKPSRQGLLRISQPWQVQVSIGAVSFHRDDLQVTTKISSIQATDWKTIAISSHSYSFTRAIHIRWILCSAI